MTVKEANQTLHNAFVDDPYFSRVWFDNIACCIRDTQGKLGEDLPNKCASRIMKHLFNVDIDEFTKLD